MKPFEYPENFQPAYNWLTVRLPILFDPWRAFALCWLVWLTMFLPAIFWCTYTSQVDHEGWYATVWSAPVIAVLMVVHVIDRLRNPELSRLAWTVQGRKLINRGTGCRRSAEDFLRHERTWAAQYAARGDTRSYQHAAWTHALELEQKVLNAQQTLVFHTSPAT